VKTQYGFHGEIELLDTSSTGTVRLRSTNPADSPLIDHNYLSSSKDMSNLKIMIQELRRWMKHPLIKELSGNGTDRFPKSDIINEIDLENWIRDSTHTDLHPAGSCPMGPQSDPLSVVDSSLRVYGVKNLRIIDASIFPTLPHGNIDQSVVLVALRGSQIILSQN